MKNQELVIQIITAMTEKLAQGRPISGHRRASHDGIEPRNRNEGAMRLTTSRICFMLVFFLVLPFVPGAQAEQGQWSDLKGLKLGQGIEVIESSMKSHGGTFVALTDEAITLREKDSNVSVKRETVARISTTSGARRGEHAVIGLVAGGLIGAGIGAASGKNLFFSRGRGGGALLGVAIGTPAGAAVGATIPAHTTIYRAPRVAASH
jgi:hypothetical protein